MSRPHCPRCQRPVSHCLCALIPSLSSQIRVVILQHPAEGRHALNTARWVALGLGNARLLAGEAFGDGLAPYLTPRSALLFPGPEARVIGPPATFVPDQLLVLDGTWRKARRLLYLNPLLAALPRLTLPAGPASRYRLRKAPGPEALSTVEAVVTALNLLEQTGRFDALLAPFEAQIAAQIEAMGPEIYQRHYARRSLAGKVDCAGSP